MNYKYNDWFVTFDFNVTSGIFFIFSRSFNQLLIWYYSTTTISPVTFTEEGLSQDASPVFSL